MTFSNSSASTSFSGPIFSVGAAAMQLAFRWDYVLIFVGLKVVQGGGLLSNIRSLLWISVEQYTTREVEVRLEYLIFAYVSYEEGGHLDSSFIF